jgi:hypothetical protein
MIRSISLGFVALFVGLAAACGGSDPAGVTGGALKGEAAPAEGAGGACPASPPPSSTLPPGHGCFQNNGSGWFPEPCGCELWVDNTAPAAISASIEITVAPDADPLPTGSGDPEVTFDDPDASWYGVWKTQAGVSVTNAAGKTTVRITGNLTLLPVPLAGCTKRIADIDWMSLTKTDVRMRAVRDDGSELATMQGACVPARPN